jgi:hypothetical protein
LVPVSRFSLIGMAEMSEKFLASGAEVYVTEE